MEANPEIRCRLVATDFDTGKRDDLFAATPPLEAKKMLMSIAVTRGLGRGVGDKQGRLKLDFIDVKRAYFHAPATREIYIKLPDEDGEEGMCGLLNKSMYWD